MLLPREKAYLEGLNSYYLDLARFIEHLQGELGSGCIYCQNAEQQILVYFNEQEIIRAIIQKRGEPAKACLDPGLVFAELKNKNYHITVCYLDQNAIYFWAQMPRFQRSGKSLTANVMPLTDLVFRLKAKGFSGFIEVSLPDDEGSALLFFHEGSRTGGSYSWGKGGLSNANPMYNEMLSRARDKRTIFTLGNFMEQIEEETFSPALPVASVSIAAIPVRPTQKPAVQDDLFSDLETALAEYLEIYSQHLRKKTRQDPLVLLKQSFIDHLDIYPFLNPFAASFELTGKGKVLFHENASRREIAAAIVHCAGKVIAEHHLTKKFQSTLLRWSYREALEERGITVLG